MKTDNVLKDKSYDFSVKVAKTCFEVQKQHKEYILSKQLLRSATSIGANVEEAIGGHSAKDFYYRVTIAHREARETHYWIRLLGDLELIDQEAKQQLLSDSDEIIRISGSIQKTMRLKLNKSN